MTDNKTNMIFRVETDLKTAFEIVAKEQDQTASQLLRRFMRFHVNKHYEEIARHSHTIAPQSTKSTTEASPTTAPTKTQQKPKKGQKLNMIPPRGKK